MFIRLVFQVRFSDYMSTDETTVYHVTSHLSSDDLSLDYFDAMCGLCRPRPRTLHPPRGPRLAGLRLAGLRLLRLWALPQWQF